jgi:molybdate transport system substrate-binding protein
VKTFAHLTLNTLCIFSSLACAQTPAPLRVFASNGVKTVAGDLKVQAEKAAGRSIAFTFDSTAGLRKHIAAGEPWDVALLTSAAIDAMLQDGSLNASTRADLARVGVGVGYKTGSRRPDVHTADGMKRALLGAKSITYAADGASRIAVEQMIDRLGLTATLKPRTFLAEGSGPATAAVVTGRADIVLTLVSEILSVNGLSLAGGIPDEFQRNITFSGAVNARTGNLAVARSLLATFKSPAVAVIYKGCGMEPL